MTKVIIPGRVSRDKDLKPNARLLYGEITRLCDNRDYCVESNAYFAEHYGVSKETVSRWISQLHDRGYISRVVSRDEKTNEVLERRLYVVDKGEL